MPHCCRSLLPLCLLHSTGRPELIPSPVLPPIDPIHRRQFTLRAELDREAEELGRFATAFLSNVFERSISKPPGGEFGEVGGAGSGGFEVTIAVVLEHEFINSAEQIKWRETDGWGAADNEEADSLSDSQMDDY